MDQTIDRATLDLIFEAQRNEITEHVIYTRLAARVRGEHNREVLENVGQEELAHHDFLARISGRKASPRPLTVWWYLFLARFLGVTFALKLMESGERTAQIGYERLRHVEGVAAIIHDEKEHERELLDLLKDERLEYAGSIVLGLSDALVELTGALAGLTLALAETRIVAMVGLITGLAASLSMAASEYLSSKEDSGSGKSPIKAAAFTGLAYVLTVVILILPYLLVENVYLALGLTLSAAVVIIALFTGYISVAKDLDFWPRFFEMALISLGVATISFALGWVVRLVFGIEG